MRCQAAGFRCVRVTQMAVVAVQEQASWVLHALHCDRCGVRDEAVALLTLAGLTEDQFVESVWDALLSGGDRG